MRRVIVSELAEASVQRESERYPSLHGLFEGGLCWQLKREPELPGEQVPGLSIFAFESIAWKAEGLPAFRVGYVYIDGGIEIVHFSFISN